MLRRPATSARNQRTQPFPLGEILQIGNWLRLRLCTRRATCLTPTANACWLSVALCQLCAQMSFAPCPLLGASPKARHHAPSVSTQAGTLCKPCSFLDTSSTLPAPSSPTILPGCIRHFFDIKQGPDLQLQPRDKTSWASDILRAFEGLQGYDTYAQAFLQGAPNCS